MPTFRGAAITHAINLTFFVAPPPPPYSILFSLVVYRCRPVCAASPFHHINPHISLTEPSTQVKQGDQTAGDLWRCEPDNLMKGKV